LSLLCLLFTHIHSASSAFARGNGYEGWRSGKKREGKRRRKGRKEKGEVEEEEDEDEDEDEELQAVLRMSSDCLSMHSLLR